MVISISLAADVCHMNSEIASEVDQSTYKVLKRIWWVLIVCFQDLWRFSNLSDRTV